MPGSLKAEVYFIAAMMVLILIFSFAASYFFIRQYRKEMRDRESRAGQTAPRPDNETVAAKDESPGPAD